MTQSQFDRRTFLTLGAVGITASAIGLRTGFAQDSTPVAGDEVAHPAHIHFGTCEDLRDVAYPLNDVVPLEADATPPALPAASPVAGGISQIVAASTTDLEVSLANILTSEHAINVHESAENIGNYIACGNITGDATLDQLVIELEELNGSGYTGLAQLVDNGDGTTTVTITLTKTGDTAATPASAHMDHGGGSAGLEVTIKDFAFDPETVTIKVGESVTWTNDDTAPHTATGTDRNVLQSGTLEQGDSFTQTFDTAGTYEYFCEFHSNMKGVVNVE